MVQMNLFPRQEQKQTRGRSGGRVTDTYALPYVKQIAAGICCMPRGAQPGAL